MTGFVRVLFPLFAYRSSAATALLPSSVRHSRGCADSPSSAAARLRPSSWPWDREESIASETSDPGGATTGRRSFIVGLPAAATALLPPPRSAGAIENPLNLKGTFWETGQLYEKGSGPASPDDDDGFLAVLEGTAEALRSRALAEAIAGGEYGRASRLLRGGLVSESKVRLAGDALVDSMAAGDDEAAYGSSESFRVFLRCFDALDAEVEAATRPSFATGGESDPRMEILTRLGKVEESLNIFLKNIKGAL